jgi:5-methyltetrahydropteroyltriglutamate--homocysteine methyltransferase
MTAVSPATLQILPNAYYKSSEDYTWALAEAIRDEYRAIVDAGFILQIDDPALVDIYDWWFSMNDDIAGYRKWATFQVEALNHALQGIPEDRVRFHICWGSWHGPHKGDVELKDVVDLLLYGRGGWDRRVRALVAYPCLLEPSKTKYVRDRRRDGIGVRPPFWTFPPG